MFPKEKIYELLAKVKVEKAGSYVQGAKRFCEPRTLVNGLSWGCR